MLRIETGLGKQESFRRQKIASAEVECTLQDPPEEFNLLFAVKPYVNYSIFNLNRDLFVSLSHFVARGIGKRLSEETILDLAEAIEMERVTVVFPIVDASRKKNKRCPGNYVLRNISEEKKQQIFKMANDLVKQNQ